jgi:hypothetical protein
LIVASVRRRLLAWLIDVTVALAGVGAIAVSVALLGKAGVLGRLARSRPAGRAEDRSAFAPRWYVAWWNRAEGHSSTDLCPGQTPLGRW